MHTWVKQGKSKKMPNIININPEESTQMSVSSQTFSTHDIYTAVLEAYENIDEIDDILVEVFREHINIRIVLKNAYSNELLEKLIDRQLIVHKQLNYSYMFNFDYVIKGFYNPNDNEISLLNNYAVR